MVCRLCLVNTRDTNHILSEGKLQKFIAKFLQLELSPNDPISNTICNSCWLQMKSFKKFVNRIEKAQARLNRALKAIPKTEEDNNFLPIKEVKSSEDFQHNTTELYRMNDDKSIKEEDSETESKSNLSSHQLTKLPILPTKINQIIAEKNSTLETNSKKKRNLTKFKKKDSKFKMKSEKYIKARQTSKLYDEIIRNHTSLSCDICSVQLMDFTDLNAHFRAVHNCRGYAVCCNKRINKRGLFVDHINVHNNPEYFKCKECDKILSDRICLQNHMLTFHQPEELKTFACDVCSEKFSKQYHLDQHKVKHVPPSEFKFTCDQCEKGFPTNANLNAHMKVVHTNLYGIMCEICAKVIRGKAAFKRHVEEHEGIVQPHLECKECGALLKDKRNLKKHITTQHSNVKQKFSCDICGKIAPSKGALQGHIKYVHELSRTFKCTLCDKSFKKEVYLKEHMATHTGEVLYTCPYCPTTFNSRCNMYAHRKKKHPEEWEASKTSLKSEKNGCLSKKDQ